jgi:hypothetical protein
MTEAEIINFLRELRYSDKKLRMCRQIIGIYTVATEAGCSAAALYNYIDGSQRPSKIMQRRLAVAINKLRREYGYEAPRPQPPARAPEQPKTSEPITKYLRFR